MWDDFEDLGDQRKFYRIATIHWSDPEEWKPGDGNFKVPAGWAGQGGIYAITRRHWRQANREQIAYIGKAINFSKRLIMRHNHFDIVRRAGPTMVSCGRIKFQRIKSHTGHYLEIEDIVKFAVWDHLENHQGFHSLPGFRKNASAPKIMQPWIIENTGYRFERQMPRKIVYPAIAIKI